MVRVVSIFFFALIVSFSRSYAYRLFPLAGENTPAPGNTGLFTLDVTIEDKGNNQSETFPCLADLGSSFFAMPSSNCKEVGIADNPTCNNLDPSNKCCKPGTSSSPCNTSKPANYFVTPVSPNSSEYAFQC